MSENKPVGTHAPKIRDRSKNAMAALAYADACGLAVFPLAPGTKIPLRGSHGELDGTTDLDTIESWWRMVPDAGIGVALRFTPYFVLDVDARSGGDAWWQAMIGADTAPTDLICESGSGWPSAHYWFRRSARLEGFHGKQVPHAVGVDLKGLPYGYVALPPTIHPRTKRPYAWWDGCSPLAAEPPDPPRWLEDAILMGATPLTKAVLALDMGLTFPRALQLLAERWPIGMQIGPGRWLCQCPNAAAHTNDGKRRNDSSCVLFAPSKPGGWGRIYCSHAHCGDIK